MESGGVLVQQGRGAENPPSMQESCNNQGNWARLDSNQRRHKPTDLQSVALKHEPLDFRGDSNSEKSRLARCWARQLQEDKRLQNLLANWENLPEPIKAAIMAMVASVQGQLR